MNDMLKRMIDATAQLIGTVLDGQIENGEGIAKLQMAEFAMYLSASDGTIEWEEARMIAQYFDLPLTQDSIADFIREHNIYSTEFESNPPVILKTLVDADQRLYEAGALSDPDDEAASELLFKTYKAIANELINCDGDEDENEVKDANIYLGMMDEYLNENLVTRRRGVSGFRKNSTTSTTGFTKSGVQAPKKG